MVTVCQMVTYQGWQRHPLIPLHDHKRATKYQLQLIIALALSRAGWAGPGHVLLAPASPLQQVLQAMQSAAVATRPLSNMLVPGAHPSPCTSPSNALTS